MKFSESSVEDAALDWLTGLGYSVLHGPDISPDGPTPRAGQLRPGLADRAAEGGAQAPQPAPARRDHGRGSAQGPTD